MSENREWTEAEEILHVKQIYANHTAEGRFTPGWSAPGIGYNWLAFASGRIYYVGSVNTVRAAVANQNDHIVACAFVGNFTDVTPTDACLAAVRALREAEWADKAVRPHRHYGGTACPGATCHQWIHLL